MTAKVSLVIPVYNELAHLPEFLELIDNLEMPFDKELVIVDDCSTDGSFDTLKSYQFKSDVKLFQQEQNSGKGAAIRRGIQAATGDIIGVQDADFEYDPEDIAQLVELIVMEKADVAYGSRFKQGHQVHRTYHYLVNRFLTLLSNMCSGLYLTDMETCYKFFRANVIKNISLENNRFGFEPEVTAKIAKLKVRVSEKPISYFPRDYIEGKKITWKDGVAALRHIFYYNLFAPKDSFFSKDMPEKYIPKGSLWL